MEVEALVNHINKHLATKMFLVGNNISAADIITLLQVGEFFRDLLDF